MLVHSPEHSDSDTGPLKFHYKGPGSTMNYSCIFADLSFRMQKCPGPFTPESKFEPL